MNYAVGELRPVGANYVYLLRPKGESHLIEIYYIR